MSALPIQQALQQMNLLAMQAEGRSAQATSSVAGGFAGELQSSIRRINQLQQTASAKSNAFQAGSPDVSLNDVMVDMQKASVSFQFGVQVRNRLVAAYKDVMAMQV
jgi:flagellar hook-basal body complex protein FliE